jgi:hypothetical protein
VTGRSRTEPPCWIARAHSQVRGLPGRRAGLLGGFKRAARALGLSTGWLRSNDLALR